MLSMNMNIRNVSPEDHRQLKALAALEGVSMEALVKRLIHKYVAASGQFAEPKRGPQKTERGLDFGEVTPRKE